MASLAIHPEKLVPESHGVNLMPFHIAHSGPAPMSSYFRIKPAPPNPPPAPVDVPTAGKPENAEASQKTEDAEEIPSPPIPIIPTLSSPIHRLLTSTKRFVSAFRGRSLHGLEVPMPKGYTGLILRPDVHGESVEEDDGQKSRRSKVPAKTNGRRTRSTRSRQAVEVDVDEATVNPKDAMDVDEAKTGRGDDDEPTRMFKPSAQFSSFVLWHPDIPVDEGKDEYLRSMSEWIELATEIHRVEED
ncbi:ribonuclease H2, subunit C [Amylostereum chailletii]|nr:ribonuclease H2, subunit C [Amylostereum chailletii]